MLPRESKYFEQSAALVDAASHASKLSVAQLIKLAEISLNLACLDAGLGRVGWFAAAGSAPDLDVPEAVDP